MDLDELTDCFATLGLKPGATLQQAKDAYRNSVQAFHPDKFPAESSSQKWANERLIVVKDAYEKLQKFFEENPSGSPSGGWKTKDKTGAESASAETEDGSMDWQAWGNQQQNSFSEEVKAWEKRQQERDEAKTSQHGKTQRQKMLLVGKVVVVAVLFLLACGKHTSNADTARRRQEAVQIWEMRNNLHVGDTMTAQQREERDQMERDWTGEDIGANIQLYTLWALTGAAVWLCFAKRPKAVLDNWAQTGETDWKELKSAAKDAAINAKTTATIAARKTVAIAEKLKAESESYLEKRAREKLHEAPLSNAKPPDKPSGADIIAAAAKERAAMEAEAEAKRQKAAKPKPKPEAKSAGTSTEKPSTEKMLAELLAAEEAEAAKKTQEKPARKPRKKPGE